MVTRPAASTHLDVTAIDTTSVAWGRMGASGTGPGLSNGGGPTMAFVQIIDFTTDKIEEGRKYVDEYEAKTEGKRTSRRAVLCADRDNPGRYLHLVFFDSYESAMQNSDLPETNELSQKLGKLMTSEPKFINLDVVEERDH